MIDLTCLEEDELCKLIDLATDELARRRGGIPAVVAKAPAELPEALAAKLRAALEAKHKQERQVEASNRWQKRHAWERLLLFAREDLGEDLWPFVDMEALPPEDLRGSVAVSVTLPGLCPIAVTYSPSPGPWTEARPCTWGHMRTNSQWRVLMHPNNDRLYEDFGTLDAALLAAHENAALYAERGRLAAANRPPDDDVPF